MKGNIHVSRLAKTSVDQPFEMIGAYVYPRLPIRRRGKRVLIPSKQGVRLTSHTAGMTKHLLRGIIAIKAEQELDLSTFGRRRHLVQIKMSFTFLSAMAGSCSLPSSSKDPSYPVCFELHNLRHVDSFPSQVSKLIYSFKTNNSD